MRFKVLLTLLVAISTAPALGAVTLVHTNAFTSGSAASSFTVSGPSTPAVNNLLIVGVGLTSGATISSAGWTCQRFLSSSFNGQFCYEIASGSTNSWTFNQSVSGQYSWFYAEFSGEKTSNPITIFNGNNISGIANQSNTITTTWTVPTGYQSLPVGFGWWMYVSATGAEYGVFNNSWTTVNGGTGYCCSATAATLGVAPAEVISSGTTSETYASESVSSSLYLGVALINDSAPPVYPTSASFMGSWLRMRFEHLLQRGY